MNNRPETRFATRLTFLAAGFAMACWAPLVPFAKRNVGVDDAGLGLLLLCLGAGSVCAMPLTGPLAMRFGSRPLIIAGGLGLAVALPVLMMANSVLLLALTLMLFGAMLGLTDVAMNVHAVEVERDSPHPLMSNFHAMFSIGGFVGAGGITLLLGAGMTPVMAALCGSVVTAGTVIIARPGLLRARGGAHMPFALPRGPVLLLAALAGIAFLVEGAVLDWSALLISVRGIADAAQGGLGYMLFAAAMTLGRLTGDTVVTRLGSGRVLFFGGWLTVLGIVMLLVAPFAVLALSGFVLIGLGASNIVPVLFSMVGHQRVMPAQLAVASVTTVGYAGVLIGPALLGFWAHQFSLVVAFALLACLMMIIPISSRLVTRIG